MFAVIKTGGKQYRVQAGDVIYVEKLDLEADSNVTFDEVLLVGKDEETLVGAPVVAGATVVGKVMAQVMGKNFGINSAFRRKLAAVVVLKYKSKKNSRKKQGHRQPYTKIEITAINA